MRIAPGLFAFAVALLTGAGGCGEGRKQTAVVQVGSQARPVDPPAATGRLIFCAMENRRSGIYIVHSDGTGLTRISVPTDEAWTFSLSSAGTVAYLAGDMKLIHVASVDGGKDAVVTPGTRGNAFPSWSPDGKRLAFNRLIDGSYQIFVCDQDGTNTHQLTLDPGDKFRPTWSPDSKSLLYTRELAQTQQLFVVTPDGSNQVNLSNNTFTDHGGCWSPDGTSIMFTRYRDGKNRICTMNADGSGQREITSGSLNDSDETWSPDGSRVAFIRYVTDYDRRIYVMKPDGSGQREIPLDSWIEAKDETLEPRAPAWSQDGRYIAFALMRHGLVGGGFDQRFARLAVVSADGHGKHFVTGASFDQVGDPLWSRN
ncbi:MAG: hypothetical protein P4L46_22100 [Fimbriimonas sp.]|nr:hypothetical protein [Fimbriimonas sp.]